MTYHERVLHAFQPHATRRRRAPRSRRADGAREQPSRLWWCAACTTRIARDDARIERSGAHRHRLVNPAGALFELGCFAAAPGCVVDGEPTTEHTWFAGFAWSYALCANCRDHLGWCFEGDGARFFGLILTRLIGPV